MGAVIAVVAALIVLAGAGTWFFVYRRKAQRQRAESLMKAYQLTIEALPDRRISAIINDGLLAVEGAPDLPLALRATRLMLSAVGDELMTLYGAEVRKEPDQYFDNSVRSFQHYWLHLTYAFNEQDAGVVARAVWDSPTPPSIDEISRHWAERLPTPESCMEDGGWKDLKKFDEGESLEGLTHPNFLMLVDHIWRSATYPRDRTPSIRLASIRTTLRVFLYVFWLIVPSVTLYAFALKTGMDEAADEARQAVQERVGRIQDFLLKFTETHFGGLRESLRPTADSGAS